MSGAGVAGGVSRAVWGSERAVMEMDGKAFLFAFVLILLLRLLALFLLHFVLVVLVLASEIHIVLSCHNTLKSQQLSTFPIAFTLPTLTPSMHHPYTSRF